MSEKMSPQELESNLAHFSGTEEYHRTSLFSKSIVHTDGVQYLAEKAGAFWLLDAIVSHMPKRKLRREPFQVWTLKKAKLAESWTLKATDGDKGAGPVTLVTQRIPYSDFPLEEIKLYVEWGGSNYWVIMLPSER